MSRYVVTGAAGFIGSHLAEELLSRGHDVVGVDCFTGYYPRQRKERNTAALRRHSRFTLDEVDLARRAPSLAGAHAVFHLAGQPGVRASWGASFDEYARNNLVATQRVLEAAARSAVRVVFASSSSVYGDAEGYPTSEDAAPRPVSPYGVTKRACEELAVAYGAAFGADVVTLRYFSVYGPRQRPDMAFARVLAALTANEPFVVLGSGRQSRDFTFVRDAVAATVAACERAPAGALYNVGGGSEVSLLDVVGAIEEIAGRRLELRFDRPAEGDARRTCADTSRIRDEVGWRPRTRLEDGLGEQVRFSLEGGRAAAAATA